MLDHINNGGIPIGTENGRILLGEITTEKSPPPNGNMPSNTRMKKVLFVGWGRAGKDEAAAYLAKITGLRYAGSFSWAALPYMAARLGIHPQLAWETRRQNRELWKKWCDELRAVDQTLLARMALHNGDICAGLRDEIELDAVYAAKLFDRIIWVERHGIPEDPTVTFTKNHPAINEILHNNGTLEQFHNSIDTFAVWAGF